MKKIKKSLLIISSVIGLFCFYGCSQPAAGPSNDEIAAVKIQELLDDGYKAADCNNVYMNGMTCGNYTFDVDRNICSFSFEYRPASDYEFYYTRSNKPDYYLDCHDDAIKSGYVKGNEILGGGPGDSDCIFNASSPEPYTTQDKSKTISNFQQGFSYRCNRTDSLIYLGYLETTKFTAKFYGYKNKFYYKKIKK